MKLLGSCSHTFVISGAPPHYLGLKKVHHRRSWRCWLISAIVAVFRVENFQVRLLTRIKSKGRRALSNKCVIESALKLICDKLLTGTRWKRLHQILFRFHKSLRNTIVSESSNFLANPASAVLRVSDLVGPFVSNCHALTKKIRQIVLSASLGNTQNYLADFFGEGGGYNFL